MMSFSNPTQTLKVLLEKLNIPLNNDDIQNLDTDTVIKFIQTIDSESLPVAISEVLEEWLDDNSQYNILLKTAMRTLSLITRNRGDEAEDKKIQDKGNQDSDLSDQEY